MTAIALKELLEAGVHFGHQTRRWNPKMKEYIFGERNGIYIIDLTKTAKLIAAAEQFVSGLAAEGRTILFVGTKKQAQEAVRTEAQRAGMPYVTDRWLGGMLTNFQTIRKSIRRMETIQRQEADGTLAQLKKKERLMRRREREKLERVLSGIAEMNREEVPENRWES